MKLSIQVLFFLFVSIFAQAQTPLLNEPNLPYATKALVIPQGMVPNQSVENRDFPMALKDSFQLALQTLRESLNSKGLSSAIITENGDTWKSAVGDSYSGVPLTPEMYLGMGSLSKSITAACMLKLQEEGLVDLDDTIGKYLPVYPNIPGSVTIRQLLNHTSGIYDMIKHPTYLTAMQQDFSKIWTPDEVLNKFVLPPLFSPGNGWEYSNTNYVLAGLIIEKASNKSFHEAVRSKLLKPIGLDNIFLNPYETTTGEIAHVWFPLGGLSIDLDAVGKTPKSVYSSAWAAGAFFCTTTQVATWFTALLNGEVLSESSLEEMLTMVPSDSYGLGINQTYIDNQPVFGHRGYIIYSSACFHDPALGLTIAIQSNDGTSSDLSPFLIKVHQLYKKLTATKSLQTIAGKAFPNPASQTINLVLPANHQSLLQIEVTNLVGQKWNPKVLSQNQNEVSLDIHDYATGTYFIRMSGGKENVVYKFVVQ